MTPWAPVGAKNRILNMDTGFEKLFVKRGHPSDKVIDGELLYVVLCNTKILVEHLKMYFVMI